MRHRTHQASQLSWWSLGHGRAALLSVEEQRERCEPVVGEADVNCQVTTGYTSHCPASISARAYPGTPRTRRSASAYAQMFSGQVTPQRRRGEAVSRGQHWAPESVGRPVPTLGGTHWAQQLCIPPRARVGRPSVRGTTLRGDSEGDRIGTTQARCMIDALSTLHFVPRRIQHFAHCFVAYGIPRPREAIGGVTDDTAGSWRRRIILAIRTLAGRRQIPLWRNKPCYFIPSFRFLQEGPLHSAHILGRGRRVRRRQQIAFGAACPKAVGPSCLWDARHLEGVPKMQRMCHTGSTRLAQQAFRSCLGVMREA